MNQPELLSIPFARDASGSTKNEIPDTPGGGAPSQQATWTQGFPAVTMQPLAVGGIPPQGQDFNGVLAALSEHTVFQNQGGIYKFDAAFAAKIGGYSKGAVLLSDDGNTLYVSLQDGNTQDPNGGSSAQWTSIYTQGRNATTAQAQALTSSDTLITPQRLGDAMNSHVLGMGQEWEIIPSRALDTTYTNTSTRAIAISVYSDPSVLPATKTQVNLYINGIAVARSAVPGMGAGDGTNASVFAIIPSGATYRVIGYGVTASVKWMELR